LVVELDEDCAPADTLNAAPFVGAVANTRSTDINTGAHDSDSASSLRPRGIKTVVWQDTFCVPILNSKLLPMSLNSFVTYEYEL